VSDLGLTQVEIRAMRRRGALVLSVFALVWAATGSSGIESSSVASILRLTATVFTVLTVALALRHRSRPASDRPRRMPTGWRRHLALVNVLQAAGIGLAIAVLAMLGWAPMTPAVVCAIVGVHFFPLARIFDEGLYAWTGALLCAVSVGGLVALAIADGSFSRSVVGLGAASVLWASSLWLSRRPGRTNSPHTADCWTLTSLGWPSCGALG
jgi:hypothetical protein